MIAHDHLQDAERSSKLVNSPSLVGRVLDYGQEAGGVLTPVDQWADHDLGPEAGAVGPGPPVLDPELARGQSGPKRLTRAEVARIGSPQERCVVASAEAGRCESEYPLDTPVPADDAARQVEVEHGAVLEAVDQADRFVIVTQPRLASCRMLAVKREH